MIHFQDRTGDFARLVESGRTKRLAKHQSVSIPQTRVPKHSEFHIVASDVAQELANTYGKLERLTKLAKSTSMYGDPAQDIQILTDDIKSSMTQLHKRLKDLEALRDSHNQQAIVHSDTVVKSLGNRLLSAKTNFLNVLETRKENLKSQYEKKKLLFGSSASTTSIAKKDSTNPLYALPAAIMPTSPSSSSNESDVAITIPPAMMQAALVERRIESRATALESVQKSIEELSHIFERVGLLVAQQGELIGRIEDDIERSETNLTGARAQLETAITKLSSNKWLTIKVGAVFAFFLIIFLVFFV